MCVSTCISLAWLVFRAVVVVRDIGKIDGAVSIPANHGFPLSSSPVEDILLQPSKQKLQVLYCTAPAINGAGISKKFEDLLA